MKYFKAAQKWNQTEEMTIQYLKRELCFAMFIKEKNIKYTVNIVETVRTK
jgi:hypothetical protein